MDIRFDLKLRDLEYSCKSIALYITCMSCVFALLLSAQLLSGDQQVVGNHTKLSKLDVVFSATAVAVDRIPHEQFQNAGRLNAALPKITY